MGQHILQGMTVIGTGVLIAFGIFAIAVMIAWADEAIHTDTLDAMPSLRIGAPSAVWSIGMQPMADSLHLDEWETLLGGEEAQADDTARTIGDLTGCIEAMCRTMRFGAREATRLEQPYLATMLANEARMGEELVVARKAAWQAVAGQARA